MFQEVVMLMESQAFQLGVSSSVSMEMFGRRMMEDLLRRDSRESAFQLGVSSNVLS